MADWLLSVLSFPGALAHTMLKRGVSGWPLGLLSALVLGAGCCLAHPMGNFSISHYARIEINAASVDVRYVVDLAEIPTFQDMRQFNVSPHEGDAAAQHYLLQQEGRLKDGLSVISGGEPVRLQTLSRELLFAEGAGGLPTLKMAFTFRGKMPDGSGLRQLTYLDNNFADRAGWKEVVVVGHGVSISQSSAPASDRSRELTNYASDVLNSPPQQVAAQVEFRTLPVAVDGVAKPVVTAVKRPVQAVKMARLNVLPPQVPRAEQPLRANTRAVVAAPVAMRQEHNTPRSRFTDLISTQGRLGFWFLLSAALIAGSLGALHALEPGHGKTMVAAYLVGSRGTAKHAVLLGGVVTAAHTAGVYLLGLLTLYASRYIVPEQLYPWLGVLSGLSVAGMAVFLFLRNRTGEAGEHSHSEGARHSHWFFSKTKQSEVETRATKSDAGRKLSLREICLLGITGGMVPCPAALVVLLSAFSLHRVGFGLFLITAFSLGLAIVLVSIGLVTVYAKRWMATRVGAGAAGWRWLPMLSSAFMFLMGVGITVSAMGSLQVGPEFLSREKLLSLVSIVLLGLFLGMRHSTDSDHVVAVSTIVSRQQSLRGSATIGLLWGLGHTITIFLVGTGIIIFGVVIPPRLGLSMEFCVALMLVLLGVLNLTGVMSWLALRFNASPAALASPGGVPVVPKLWFPRLRAWTEGSFGQLGLYQSVRPLVVGLVHGLAGSAAVALLVLSTIRNPFWATAYLVIFGFGTTVGMMIMTAAISVPLVYTGKKFLKVNRYLITVSGFASMAFGLFLVFRIGFVDGLFTAQAHWIPQ